MTQQHKNLWGQLKKKYDEQETNNSFFPLMLSMAKRLTQNNEDANDLVQSTVESFLNTKPKRSINNIYGFVYLSLRNHFLNIVDSKQRRAKHEGHYAALVKKEYQDVERKEDLDFHQKLLLQSLKNQFNKKDYQLIEMLYAGMPIDDIAIELGVSVKRIKNRRSEIRKKLRIPTLLILILFDIYRIFQTI